MKYNAKYDRWVTTGGLVYRYKSKQDKLVLCKLTEERIGYMKLNIKGQIVRVHRLVWETFIGEIPDGYEIDHINALKNDNRLINLRCVTHKGNMNNILNKKRQSKVMKGRTPHNKGKKAVYINGKLKYVNT